MTVFRLLFRSAPPRRRLSTLSGVALLAALLGDHVRCVSVDHEVILGIQRRLGHESIKTTSDTYGHLADDADQAAAAALD